MQCSWLAAQPRVRKQIKIKTNKTYCFKQVWNSWYSAEAQSYMNRGGLCSLHSCAVITGKGKTWKSVHKITSSICLVSISVELPRITVSVLSPDFLSLITSIVSHRKFYSRTHLILPKSWNFPTDTLEARLRFHGVTRDSFITTAEKTTRNR